MSLLHPIDKGDQDYSTAIFSIPYIHWRVFITDAATDYIVELEFYK